MDDACHREQASCTSPEVWGSLYFLFVTLELVSDETIEVGVDIDKQFTDESGRIIGLFRGYVGEVDVDECDGSVLYTIIYEDGDTEDMYAKECSECIELDRKWESGEIKEWGIGGDE